MAKLLASGALRSACRPAAGNGIVAIIPPAGNGLRAVAAALSSFAACVRSGAGAADPGAGIWSWPRRLVADDRPCSSARAALSASMRAAPKPGWQSYLEVVLSRNHRPSKTRQRRSPGGETRSLSFLTRIAIRQRWPTSLSSRRRSQPLQPLFTAGLAPAGLVRATASPAFFPALTGFLASQESRPRAVLRLRSGPMDARRPAVA